MKAGDLVTLSARGYNLVALTEWKEEVKTGKMIGLVKSCRVTRWEQSSPQYYVDWIGGHGPTHGRDRWSRYFLRSDLKMVSKAK